jgi:hypothetical protein
MLNAEKVYGDIFYEFICFEPEKDRYFPYSVQGYFCGYI